MKYFLSMCFLIICCSCARRNVSEGDLLVYKILSNCSNAMSPKNLSPSVMLIVGEEKIIFAAFKIDQVLTYLSAKETALELLDQFLKTINDQNDIKIYLAEYPVTQKKLKLVLNGLCPENKPTDFVQSVHIGSDFICFYSDSAEPPLFGLLRKENLLDGSVVEVSQPQEKPTTFFFLDHESGKLIELKTLNAPYR